MLKSNEHGNRCAAVPSAALAVAPENAFGLTGGYEPDGSAEAATLDLFHILHISTKAKEVGLGDGRIAYCRFGSFIAIATTIPEARVNTPTTPIATGMPNRSAKAPAIKAPIA